MSISLLRSCLVCILAGVVVCATARFGASPASAEVPVDTLYYNGVIYTMTETPREAANADAPRTVEAVAARGGRILFTGTAEEARKRGYFRTARRVVDLKGKSMLPGFVDGHGHFPEQGQYDLYEINLNSFPLGAMSSIEDYQRVLGARCAAVRPGEWVIGWGYDDSSITDRRHPTREDIDAVCPDNPVYLRHISGHMGVANSQALEQAGITPANPEKLHTEGVVRDTQGRAAGLLMETRAMGLVTSLPDFPVPDPLKSLARASHVYAAAGVTTADQGASMLSAHLPLFRNGLARKALPLRVVLHPLAVYELVSPGGGVIDAAGWMNRAALGWRDAASRSSSEGDELRFSDASGAVKSGEDITRLPVRIYGMDARGEVRLEGEVPIPGELPSGMLFLGAWKLLFDGSPQGYTAWLKAPGYYDWGTYTAADSFDGAPFFNGARGTLNISPAGLERLLALYHRAGQSTETHVNGNASAEAWIAAMEKAVSAAPDVADTRHTAIHAQMLELQHIQRMTGNYGAVETDACLYTGLEGAFGGGSPDPDAAGAADIEELAGLMKKQHLFSSYFIDHVYFWGDRHRNIFMGPGRANNMSPVGWSIYYDQPYGFHSDTFVTPIHPLRSVQTAVTRLSAPTPLSGGGTLISGTGRDIRATVELPARDPAQTERPEMGVFPDYDQRINALQALLGVTRLPAWQNKLDDRIGSLREGLAADFVILEEDPLRVAREDPQRLASIRVMAAVVGDRPVYGFLPGAGMLAGVPSPSYIGNEDTEITLLSVSAAPDSGMALQGGERLLGAYVLRAESRGGGDAVFQMDMLGNGCPVNALRLYRRIGEKVEPFVYAEKGPLRSGMFRAASLREPARALTPDEMLREDAPYIVFFAPGGERNRTGESSAEIAAEVLLTTTGSLPGNGGTTPGA
ncbi:MAG TPA: amidohydrolase [Candidatus Mailhella excrementigallinarum]|nr:amidohydrolase [Candidatus Mailhella excrementigallinarum]